MRKTVRTLAVVASAAMVLGAFVGPADAGKKKKRPPVVAPPSCPAPTFSEPKSDSPSRTTTASEKVVTITDAATAEAPLTIDFAHGHAVWLYIDPRQGTALHQAPLVEDTKWFNIQVDSASAAGAVLNGRLEWPTPSLSDIDFFAWDAASGEEVARSGAANVTPSPLPGDTGAQGFEQFLGASVSDCQTITFESRAFYSKGESMKLKVWLGE